MASNHGNRKLMESSTWMVLQLCLTAI
ncbi:hypothetical protein ACHAW6_014286 [Cyclotella cf. meneghiniana]